MREIDQLDVGKKIYSHAAELFPICRSITGKGVYDTLQMLNGYIKQSGYVIAITKIPSGTNVFDWTIPREWDITDAYIENEFGDKIVDFKTNNLHVMGYSAPVDKWVTLDELKKYVYTEPEQPDVIPYVTSYYKERFGFCMSQNQLDLLPNGKYHMVIDSRLFDGHLVYGEVLIPGKTDKEVFFSTYICHPSMANDNCSGPALAVELINYVAKLEDRKYSYRFIFIPETIGAISYISRNLDAMKKNMYAGFNLSCVGDNLDYSMIHTICGDTIADKVLRNILEEKQSFTEYPFIKRASDERQYNAPGIDLPVVGFCRTKYGEFPEYHTSADDLNFVNAEGFAGSYDVLVKCIEAIENNYKYRVNVLCEPQLGKRGLYPTISHKNTYNDVHVLCDILAYADGKRDLIDISNSLGVPVHELMTSIRKLLENGLLEIQEA